MRSRSGAAELGRLRAQLRKGWPEGLTVLTGDDLYHLDAAQRALLAELVPAGQSEFALTVFGEECQDLSTILAAARSAAMFAPRRVVLVREVEKLSGDPEELREFARHPPARSYLLVRAPSLDRRRNLHKALLAAAPSWTFALPKSPARASPLATVRALARERGIELAPEAAALLAEAHPGDLYRIVNELDKLRAWLGENRRRVDLAVVRDVACADELLAGWEVNRAIERRDREGALRAVRKLVESGDAPIRIIGSLGWRARTMLQAKALHEAGFDPAEIRRKLRIGGRPDQWKASLSRYSRDELLAFPSRLLEADRLLRSSLDPRAVLEDLVVRLTAGPEPAARGRGEAR